MYLNKCFIIAILTLECYARNALKYFVEQKKILNSSVTVLMSFKPDVVWVEYKYYFEAKELNNSIKMENVLNVGIFQSDNSLFDCNIHYDNNRSMVAQQYRGYSFEIINLLQERLNFGINYVLLNYSSSKANLSKELKLNKVDLLACHPEINFEQESQIAQLHPTLRSDYVLIYKPNKLHFTKDIFTLTFAGTLWLCFLILLVTLAICMRISTKQYSIIYPNKYQSWSWVDITLWINAAACQQGLSYTPNGYASRVIFFLSYLTSYLLYTGFAAGITSLLLKQSMNSKLTLDDIASKKFTIVVLSQVPFVKPNHHFTNKTLYVPHIEDLFIQIDQDNTVGIAPKLFIDQYFARQFNYEMIASYSIAVVRELRYSTGFATLKSNKNKRVFNKQILALQELGLLKNALQLSLLPSPQLITRSNYSSAGIEHVGSAILILLVGTLSSTVFLVAELTFAVYQSRVQNKPVLIF